MLELGNEVFNHMPAAERREWLVTNGIGGFAMGTVTGTLTRRYHGLLIAALNPPLDRTLLVSKVDEVLDYHGRTFPLYSNRWKHGPVEAEGFQHLRGFRLEGSTPVWSYSFEDGLLEKRVWMQNGANTSYLQYKLVKASAPVRLSAKVLINSRDYHGETQAGSVSFEVNAVPGGISILASNLAIPFYALSREMALSGQHYWYDSFYLSVEAYRGLPDVEANYFAGLAVVTLNVGQTAHLTFTTDSNPNLDGLSALDQRKDMDTRLLTQAYSFLENQRIDEIDSESWTEADIKAQLVLAADQFVVRRSSLVEPEGMTVIAGYPWFGDWGRDTMIALPGLTLVTGRADEARKILRTFAAHVDRGMLPNRFPDVGEKPEYNTADATLWYFEALRAYYESTEDKDLIQELYPILTTIVDEHVTGTRFNIGLDPADGLIYAGEQGVQLTWMDAKVDNWVVTPRIGKPVEINALWYNTLEIMASFADLIGESPERFQKLAWRAKKGFGRFWNDSKGYCYDVLDGPDGDDLAMRPNQILAVSLRHSPLSGSQRKMVVDSCASQLLTPYGLRTLSPDHPAYAHTYGGDIVTRDSAYHQGTVWAWLIGPFVAAYLRVYGEQDAARLFLQPLLQHVGDYGLGTVSEIFDGDSPFTPRGCPAQAWSVAELLTTLQITSGTMVG